MSRPSFSRLRSCLAFLPWLFVSFALTGCPLHDDYSLASDTSGGTPSDGGDAAIGGSGGSGSGVSGSGVGGAGASAAGMGGATTGATGVAGTAGTDSSTAGSANGGVPSAGNGGNSATGGDSLTGGGPSAGTPDQGGEAGEGATVGAAGAGVGGASGSGGASGGSGTGGDSSCAALACSYTCCPATGASTVATCADMTRDFQNCGACGKLCNAGRSCMSSTCTPGWVGMAAPPVGFAARWRAASVAMGSSVFIWGGSDSTGNVLDSGAIYSPVKDSWTTVAKDANTPTARVLATAVWTGSVVIVFGGSDAAGATSYKDGGVYDPVANAWSPLPAASKARTAPLGFWDGKTALFYGGTGALGATVAGADRFDLSTWTSSSVTGDPGAVSSPAWGWDGSAMYLEGGQVAGTRTDKVCSYISGSDTWASLSKSLTARSNAFGVWDGAHFLVWGGRDDMGNLHNDGKYPTSLGWTTMSAFGAPSARMLVARRSGSIFETSPGVVALFGGQTSLAGQGTFSTSGATYDLAAAKWGTIPTVPSGEAHDYGVAVWTGDEFVLWGGRTGVSLAPTLTGERWKP